MKNFFTSMLGALVALMVFFGGCFVLFIGFIAAMAAAAGNQEKTPAAFEKGSYLVLDLGTAMADAPQEFDLSMFGSRRETLQTRAVTHALQEAAKDERIAGVFLSGDLSQAAFTSGYASLREVRDALNIFKESGKPVVAYLTFATTKTYYLASAATDLVIDPYGVILVPGLSTEPMFFAGAFEKYGVNVQVTRAGKYKSAVEPFVRRDMSPENREELQKLLNDIWSGLLTDMAPNRELTPQKIQATVDREGLLRAAKAKEHGFVDRVAYRDEIYDELKEKTGRKDDPKRGFKQVALEDYIKSSRGRPGSLESAGSKIAVVYAEGDIVDGEGDIGQVGGSRFSRELRRLRQDPNVKAIVLRVNSPGGSATASEAIQREVRLTKEVKPVVVSMGSYAASGGYWIATYADRIFAEPVTITGSIGVFGIQFDVQQLANNVGITFDRVTTGRFAGSLTITRPKTPEEMAIVQGLIDWTYDQFLTKVAESRGLPRAKVEEIAQGRVWSGSEAKKLGLVDDIGGLDAAIRFAAEKANLGEKYRLLEYPRRKELVEAIQELIEKKRPNRAESSLTHQVVSRVEQELKTLQSFNDPKGVYARLPLNLPLQ